MELLLHFPGLFSSEIEDSLRFSHLRLFISVAQSIYLFLCPVVPESPMLASSCQFLHSQFSMLAICYRTSFEPFSKKIRVITHSVKKTCAFRLPSLA